MYEESSTDAFRRVMAPTVQAIIDLTTALDAVTPRHSHLPAPTSKTLPPLRALTDVMELRRVLLRDTTTGAPSPSIGGWG